MASNGILNLANGSNPVLDPTMDTVNAGMQASTISSDDIALYDRQIRLWGVQAQQKIQNANILLITVKGLGNEIAKNLVLAGIKTLTMLDHELVTEDDIGGPQFLISATDRGKNRAEAAAPFLREMNPKVGIFTDTDMASVKPHTYFAAYDIVIATDLNFPILVNISDTVRFANVRFFAAGSIGMYGYIFADLIEHDFVIERQKPNVETKIGPETTTCSIVKTSTKRENEKTVESVTKRERYCPLRLANSSPLPQEWTRNSRRLKSVTPLLTCTRALWEFENTTLRLPTRDSKEDLVNFTRLAQLAHATFGLPTETLTSEFLRAFLQNIGAEIPGVTAVLGGYVGEHVINVLGQKEHPIQNLLLFDGDACYTPVFSLYTQMPPPLVPSVNGAGSVAELPILQQAGPATAVV